MTVGRAAPDRDYIGPMTARRRAELAERVESLAVERQAATAVSPGTVPGTAVTVAPMGPISLTIEQAMLLALQHNQALVVERLTPSIARTVVEQQRAIFDPVMTAEYALSRTKVQPDKPVPQVTEGDPRSAGGSVGARQFLPTGTSIQADLATDRIRTFAPDRYNQSRAGLTLTQALLRGYGLEVNLVGLRQARLDVLSSRYELRGFTEALLAQVQQAYWSDVLAQRQIAIFEESLHLAEKQLDETQERINVGRLAMTELAAAQAEVALRQESLINARSAQATARLRLLRLLNPPGNDLWSRPLTTESQPVAPAAGDEDVEDHVALALRLRSDLNQARLGVQRNDLELVRTRNGLLPRMDLFVALGRSGYADSFSRSMKDISDGHSRDVTVGMALELPPLNRDARARHQRAELSRRQAAEALTNLEQLIQVDVRSACIEVLRTREQVAATAATRTFQEENLRAETEKFRVGKSTTLLVAQVQRDLLSAKIGEVEAVVNYIVALIDLYRLDGSLLIRCGVQAPGDEPVVLGEGL
jgi:outer membrane protein TolC